MFRTGHAAGNIGDAIAWLAILAAVAHANAGSGSVVEHKRPFGFDRGDAGQHKNRRQYLQVSETPILDDTECGASNLRTRV